MLRRNSVRFPALAAWIILAAVSASAADTALDRYVKAPDPSYSFKVANTFRGEGYTLYVVDMTSQTWRKPSEVDRTK